MMPLLSKGTIRSHVLAVILLTTVLAFYLAMRREGHDWGGDFSLYIMHARNIASLHRYADTPFVFDPQAMLQSPPAYPPGFPIMLAPAYALFGLNYAVLKTVCILLVVGALVPIYLIGRQRIGDAAVWLIPLVGLTYPFLSIRDSVVSEGCYLLFSYAGLAYAVRAYANGSNIRTPLSRGVITGALFGFAYMTRTVGIALPMALVAYDIVRNRRFTLYMFMTGVAFVALAVVSSLIVGENAGYSGQFELSIASVVSKLVGYLKALSSVWINAHNHIGRYIAWAVFTLLALLGGLVTRRKDQISLPEWYLCIYLGGISLYFATPFRYLVPLVPIYLILVLQGMVGLKQLVSLRTARIVTAGAVALMSVTIVANLSTLDRSPLVRGIQEEEFHAVSDFLRRNVARDDGVASWNPRVFALYTNTRSLAPLAITTIPGLRHYYERNNVRYLVVAADQPSDHTMATVVETHPAAFDQVYANRLFRVYRVDAARLQD